MSMFINLGHQTVYFNGNLSDSRYMNDDKKLILSQMYFPGTPVFHINN